MTDIAKKLNDQWQDTANLVLGIWLLISPWLLGYATDTKPAWNAHAVGVIIAVAAAAALIAFQKWEEWVNVVLAAWLVISPHVLGYLRASGIVEPAYRRCAGRSARDLGWGDASGRPRQGKVTPQSCAGLQAGAACPQRQAPASTEGGH